MGTAGSKVIVASKLSCALELQLQVFADVQHRVRENSWTEKVAQKTGDIVRIHGTAYPIGQMPDGFRDRPKMIVGYALTPGIDKEWWDKWVTQNKDTPFVKNGLVFAFATEDAIRQRARKEFSDVRSGMEPVDPKGDSRIAKPLKGAADITISGSAGPTDLDLAS